MLNNFSPKIGTLRDKVDKFGTAGQATDDNVALCFACWIRKATDTYWEYVILIAFRR